MVLLRSHFRESFGPNLFELFLLSSGCRRRRLRDLLDSWAHGSARGRCDGHKKRRQPHWEVLPGNSGVQLPGQSHHIFAAGRWDAEDVQVHPVLSVWENRRSEGGELPHWHQGFTAGGKSIYSYSDFKPSFYVAHSLFLLSSPDFTPLANISDQFLVICPVGSICRHDLFIFFTIFMPWNFFPVVSNWTAFFLLPASSGVWKEFWVSPFRGTGDLF